MPAAIVLWDYHVYFAGEREAKHFYDIPNHSTQVARRRLSQRARHASLRHRRVARAGHQHATPTPANRRST